MADRLSLACFGPAVFGTSATGAVGWFEAQVRKSRPDITIVWGSSRCTRVIQGYFGSFVLCHHIFSGTDEKQASQAWKTWLAGL